MKTAAVGLVACVILAGCSGSGVGVGRIAVDHFAGSFVERVPGGVADADRIG